MSVATWGWLVLLFPLLGSILIGVGYKLLPARAAGLLGTVAIVLSFACGVGAFFALQGEPESSRHVASTLWTYADAGPRINLGIYVDPLSIFMVLVVTFVSSLIHIYSIDYMASDVGYRRFFSYMNFFVFSMLLLVLAGNFVLLIVGWAFVGFASYALISFWYRRRTAADAGMKAFVINVVGDVGLVLAAILIFKELGVVDYGAVFAKAPTVFHTNEWTVVAICLLLLVGCVAKSAQLPLHTWLPDAMEGPTPVSSLIHAATMVTAGVYLIARAHPLFELAPTAADVAAFIGLATLLAAGAIAIVVTDIKRIIAYSTMSQIGYMMVGVGIGAYSAGLFHLMTHAFFKALLFMAAGSIIAAMANRQDIDRMSGFGKALPFTAATFVIGGLALAAFPGTSGFFSKDEIIAFATMRGGMYDIFTVGGYIGAFMTAIYTFRIIFRVLPGPACEEATHLIETGEVAHGEYENMATGEKEDPDVGFPGPEHHIAEQAPSMKIAMGVLSFCALFGGLLQIPGVDSAITNFLAPTFRDSVFEHMEPSVGAAWVGLAIGAAIAIAGIATTWFLYRSRTEIPKQMLARLRPLHTALVNLLYVDQVLDALTVRPLQAMGRIFDGLVERGLIGGLRAGTVGIVRGAGIAVRDLQSGWLRSYALVMVVGIAAIGLYFLIQAS